MSARGAYEKGKKICMKEETQHIGKCETCGDWPVYTDGTQCDKCREAKLDRIAELAGYTVTEEEEEA